jgi:WD40 repeat protein
MQARSLLQRSAFVLVLAGACVLAACGSSVVMPIPTPTPKVLKSPQLTYAKHTTGVFGAWWSPDGTRLVSASGDATAQIWDAMTGKQLLDYMSYTSGVTWADWSRDGKYIVTSSGYAGGISSPEDSVAKVWDMSTGKTLVTYRGHSAYLNAAYFSPDGARIVSTSADKTAQVWDAKTGKTLVVYRGHSAEVALAAWSTDGTRIATASQDDTVQVWDAATGKTLLTHRASAQVWGVSWSPDGKLIASSLSNLNGQATNGAVEVWDPITGKCSLPTLAIPRIPGLSTGHQTASDWLPRAAMVLCASGRLPAAVLIWCLRVTVHRSSTRHGRPMARASPREERLARSMCGKSDDYKDQALRVASPPPISARGLCWKRSLAAE